MTTYRDRLIAAFIVGLVVSVLLFSDQSRFVGYAVRVVPELGDITFFVGFVLSAAVYLIFARTRIRARVVAA
ncbi:hypothetical protein [Nocardia sp. NPDC051570]|uniref:hypothetical protein n=1 Tax=Nocardia sp. NPDC051570 TaxID=3364324 RepID=UPI0037A9B326